MIFYDFEVFKYDWLVVLVNPEKQSVDVIVNNKDDLQKFYDANKADVWVGYNSNYYDQYILKGILCGFDPKRVNDFIIEKGKAGYEFSSMFRQIPLYSYDCMIGVNSLKQLEGFTGTKIKESSIPFDIDRKLTEAEIDETIEYCKHDVFNTLDVFMRTKSEFDAILSLIRTFDLPLNYISKTKAQISAIILGCERKKWDDEFDIEFVPTLNMGKYQHIMDWFADKNNHDYNKSLSCMVANTPHDFGWGGVHGAKKDYHTTGCIVHVDVTSYYPSLMIEYNLLSRNTNKPEKFKEIYDTRVALKNAGKKKEQAPYKIVLNGTYGICKDERSLAYDPRQANNVCINGQLLLIDLIDKCESIEGFELIQSNTDGLIVKIPNTEQHFEQLDDICHEWEQRTRMGLGFDFVEAIWQKDVNNYIFRDVDGKLERKGSYVKELNELDNNLPIVNKACVDYIAYDIPIEQTINECNELKQFQMICKISNKYKCLMHTNPKTSKHKIKKKEECRSCIHWGTFCGYTTCQKYNLYHENPKGYNGIKCDDYKEYFEYNTHTSYGDEVLSEKCVRVFASKDKNDGGLYKLHKEKTKPDKFPSTPTHCFINNEDVNGVSVPTNLDREFYINMAKERVKGFGKNV